MRRLVLAIVVVAVLLLGANYAARLYAQQVVASRLASALGASSHPRVRIGGFPFLWDLLADGTVGSVRVHTGPTSLALLRVAAVNATVERVRVQKSSLLLGGAVKVLSTGPANVEAVVTARQISAAVGQPVHLLADGNATTVIFGSTLTLHPSFTRAGGLSLGVPGFAGARLALPSPLRLGGCAPLLHISAGRAVFGCNYATVPQAILQNA